LKQFEFKSSILDTAKDVVDSIPFIDLNGLFEVKNEVGVYLFFSSLGVMQLVPFVNYFLKSKH
jgi:hypothetical protein